MLAGALGQTEVENLGLIAIRYKDVGRFDVAVNDALGVRTVEGVSDLDAEVEKFIQLHRLPVDRALQGLAFEQFHGEEVAAILLADFVDGADARVIESGSGARLALKTFEG